MENIEENKFGSKTRRTPVKRMLDSINDMKPSDREELTMALLDASLEEAPLKAIESEPASLLGDYEEEIKERDKTFGQMVGLGTGMKVIDDMTMGLAPGELIIVAAPTSVGKTMLCLNIAANLAIAGHAVGFITMEMTKPEIGTRLKKIMGEDYGHMVDIIVNKSDRMSWHSVDMFVKRSIEEAGIEALFIDHLHYFSRSMDNTAEELGLITQEFKHLAIKYNIPIILISHTRKTDNMGQEREATMNDLRGSSFIAQDADIVLMLNRVWEETDMGKIARSDATKVSIEKNRNRFGVPIGSSFIMRRDGLKFEGRLSPDEQIAWDKNKPKAKTGFGECQPQSYKVETPPRVYPVTPVQTQKFDQSDLI